MWLNCVDFSPMYALVEVGVVTSHWYIIFESRHFEFSGQSEGLWQLHVLEVCVGILGALSFLVLEDEIFCAMLGVVEYEILILIIAGY